MDVSSGSVRTVLRGAVGGLGALACLVALGAVTASTLPAGAPPLTGVGRFVPSDGQGRQVGVATGGAGSALMVATLEQTVVTDPTGVVAMLPEPGLLAAADPDFAASCAADDCPAPWWREHLYSSGWQTQSDRVYAVTARGIEVRWLDLAPGLSLALAPGAVLLPATPQHGLSWDAAGSGMMDGLGPTGRGSLQWSVSGRVDATPPTLASGPADAGCLGTTVDFALTGGPWGEGTRLTWDDHLIWCPGQGVVERGPARGALSSMSGFQRLEITPSLTANSWDSSQWPGPDRLGILTPRPLDFSGGTEVAIEQYQSATMPWPTDAAGLVVLESGRTDLTAFDMGSGHFGAEQQRTGLRPGGRVEHVGWAGGTLLVATSQRRLVSYLTGSTRAWDTELPDLAASSPVTSGSNAIVLTIDGTVTGYDLGTGELAWQLRVPGGRLLAGGDAMVAVVDGGGRITLVDPFGKVTRLQGHPDPVGVAVSNGRVVTWGADWIGSPSRPGRAGQSTWLHQGRSIGQAEAYAKSYGWGRVAVRTGDRLEVLDVSDGRLAWSAEHIRGMGAVHGGLALVDDSFVWTVDENGAEVARLLLPFWQPGPDDEVTVRADRTMMWVLARNPAGQVSGQMLGRESQ